MHNQPLPILLTDNFFLFPSCNQILTLENNDYLKRLLVAAWKSSHRQLLIISSKVPLSDNNFTDHEYDPEKFYSIGSLARIEIDLSSDADPEVVFNSLRDVKLGGIDRVQLLEVFRDYESNVWQASYEILREDLSTANQHEANLLNDLTERFIRHLPNLLKHASLSVTESIPYLAIGDLGKFIDFIVQGSVTLAREIKQAVLEEFQLARRMRLLLEIEKKTRKLQQNIQLKINEKIIEQQNAIYLREQLNTIQAQLNKLEGVGSEMDVLQKRLDSEYFPEEVKDVVRKEIKNYERSPANSTEANMVRAYVDWLINLPWKKATEEKNDLQFAYEELNKEHFGLEKIKERIIEHLAVIKQTNNSLGQVICFVGPPGVGKTSLASSIAKATGRNFVRMSVGGISDEAEIRGHRRTYIGSLPGKIIQEMKKAGVVNPVFLIDEIDKIGGLRAHGDPASALLEILDPSQNSKFMDNYLGDVSYDLSKVLFICTANSVDLPKPLLDRMELVHLSSYTEIEKLHIAIEHLIPRNLESYNVHSSQMIQFTESAIKEIIHFYTREAGVRELNRMIQKIIRKFIVKVLRGEMSSLTVDANNVSDYLGNKIYDFTTKKQHDQVGVATGLAYTYAGGDILSLEVSYFPGKGNLLLTGTLGDVMKESANIALDYIKANHQLFGISPEKFSQNDIHVHVPEGATPKDGPSAGISIATAIVSALTNKEISTNVGMTGEITLRGYVLPIGGLREKSIAAHRSGLKVIIIPEGNRKDLDEIPNEVRSQLEIIFVEDYQQVWKTLTTRDF